MKHVARAVLALVLLQVFVPARLIQAVADPPFLARSSIAAGELQPVTRVAVRHDTSGLLSAVRVTDSAQRAPGGGVLPLRAIPRIIITTTTAITDPVVQPQPGSTAAPSATLSFEGISATGLLPPDTNGDVGPRHYVQMVNSSLAVYDKTNGALLLGPIAINALWSGFGGPCETLNDGDPIVLYDQLADRWLVSQFANIRKTEPTEPYYQCIAISTTPDPTGSYHRYGFAISDTKSNDYPKFGVWPDGYYMSINQFTNLGWGGAGVAVFERDKMLAGLPARQISFDLYAVNPNFGGMLPSDWEGSTPPPPGAPNYFAEVDDDAWNWTPADQLRVWEFHVDWSNPSQSSFGIGGSPNVVLDTAPFNSILCPYGSDGDPYRDEYPYCIPQPGQNTRLDSLSDRLMHRLTYRNFGTHEMLLVNHTVAASSAGQAGVRWYELRKQAGSWSIYQQSTYGPNDGLHRWMASLAMDGVGNIALGYSASSSASYPSIRYTGRRANDPRGSMTLGEAVLRAGGGSQTHSSGRWGDYTAMNVDPVDDCTFWYTNEYYPATSAASWHTWVAAFRLPGCARGTVSGTVTNAVTHGALPNALVWASAGSGQATTTRSGSDGVYRLDLGAGTYTLTAAVYGYSPKSVPGVTVTENAVTRVDIALALTRTHVVSGVVTDQPTGRPVQAEVRVNGWPLDPPITSTTTNRTTGFYSFTLASGQAYTLTAVYFRVPTVRPLGVLVADRTVNFSLRRQLVFLPVMSRR